MEPLIVINGDETTGNTVIGVTQSFNGAVDRDQRRPSVGVGACAGASALQWSR